jgi:hypothetical protein
LNVVVRIESADGSVIAARGGWIVRERDPSDRRAVVVRVVRDRFGELLGLYAGMGRAMNTLLRRPRASPELGPGSL